MRCRWQMKHRNSRIGPDETSINKGTQHNSAPCCSLKGSRGTLGGARHRTRHTQSWASCIAHTRSQLYCRDGSHSGTAPSTLAPDPLRWQQRYRRGVAGLIFVLSLFSGVLPSRHYTWHSLSNGGPLLDWKWTSSSSPNWLAISPSYDSSSPAVAIRFSRHTWRGAYDSICLLNEDDGIFPSWSCA